MRYVSFNDEPTISPDEFFMNEALKEAKLALSMDEVPIGAVIVSNGKIIGRGHNLTERLNDVTAHAEMQAFTAAANYLGGKYLKDCTLYVTI
jgi:tRNA(adenine34) deaminase